MDTVAQLTEECFGRLCTIAIDKCNDKMEKRRAGCGGKAMRKRVLIKNFVSDLLKCRGDQSCDEDISECPEEDANDSLSSDSLENSMCETEETEELQLDLLDEQDIPKNDCWLSSGSIDNNQYNDYSNMGTFDQNNEGTTESSDELKSFESVEYCDPRIDVYSSYVNNFADENVLLKHNSLDVITHAVPANGFDCAYNLSMSSVHYELEPLSNLTSLCNVSDSPLQPVRAEASDQAFLSLKNNSYSEMKTYTALTESNSLDEMNPPLSQDLTDLDAHKSMTSPMKRKSDEVELSELFDKLMMFHNSLLACQKRLKL